MVPRLWAHPDTTPLARLLAAHLPRSLPTYNSALSASDTSLFASFPPEELPQGQGSPPWLVLASLGTDQLRPFCSLESQTAPLSADELATGVDLLLDCTRDYVERFAPPKEQAPMLRLGAVNSTLCASIAQVYAPLTGLNGVFVAPSTVDGAQQDVELPAGMVLGTVRAEDIPEVVRTSEVPHSPAYLASRLPHSSAIFTVLSTHSPSPSQGPYSPLQIVAHCFTHRDGSLGTLHVAPSHRRLGLGTILLQDRRRKEQDLSIFAYVLKENEGSRSLMQSARWVETWDCVWFAVAR